MMQEITIAEWEIFEQRTALDREDEEAMGDPMWRICNLYRCIDYDKQDAWFTPTTEQSIVLICIFVRGWLRIIIPKSRQLGMSLLLQLICADGVAFRGLSAAWVDKTLPDAHKKLQEKFLFAFDRLPAEVLAGLEVISRDAKKGLVIRSSADALSLPSSFEVGKTFRGGTVQILVLSEWGWIQYHDPLRSKEINEGAMPAIEKAEEGLCVVETTWEGGLDGQLGPYVNEALTMPEAQRGRKSWRILFFGWLTDSRNRQSHGQIDRLSAEYFQKLEGQGIKLDAEQKLWYAEKRRLHTVKIKNEYPTVMHECWEQVPEGSIYGEFIELAKTEGRVNEFLPDKRWPVHTVWDLGHPMNTVTWLIQVTPQAVLVLDVLMEKEWTLEQRAAHLRALGWDYGVHCIPWESAEDNSHSIKPVDEFRRVLGASVRVVPVIRDKWIAINGVRTMFGRFVFRLPACAVGLDHLGRYRAVRETANGMAKDEPVHDKYSHAADAFRQLWQAMQAGIIASGNVVGGAVSPSAHSAPTVIKAGRRM